jgi:FlaA1/EpsC-like NDP-sugar epimerase
MLASVMSETGPAISARSVSEVIDRLRASARANEKPRLSAAALAAVAAEPPPALSPIVLAGVVRFMEFALILAIGFSIHAIYLLSSEGFSWQYGAATCGIAVLSIVAFQAADIYQVQAFRGYEKQYMRLASAWSLVFLLVIGISFFAKIGEQFSRVWLGSFYVAGLLALVLFRRVLFLVVRHWTNQGYLTLRTVIVGGSDAGASVIKELKRQKNLGIEIVGLFDDRADERSGAEIAGEPKLGTVDDLVEFGRRTRIDLVIFWRC